MHRGFRDPERTQAFLSSFRTIPAALRDQATSAARLALPEASAARSVTIAPMNIGASGYGPCQVWTLQANTHVIPWNWFSRHCRDLLCRACGAHTAEHLLAFAPVRFPDAGQRCVFLRHLPAEPAPVARRPLGRADHYATGRPQSRRARGALRFRPRAHR